MLTENLANNCSSSSLKPFLDKEMVEGQVGQGGGGGSEENVALRENSSDRHNQYNQHNNTSNPIINPNQTLSYSSKPLPHDNLVHQPQTHFTATTVSDASGRGVVTKLTSDNNNHTNRSSRSTSPAITRGCSSPSNGQTMIAIPSSPVIVTAAVKELAEHGPHNGRPNGLLMESDQQSSGPLDTQNHHYHHHHPNNSSPSPPIAYPITSASKGSPTSIISTTVPVPTASSSSHRPLAANSRSSKKSRSESGGRTPSTRSRTSARLRSLSATASEISLKRVCGPCCCGWCARTHDLPLRFNILLSNGIADVIILVAIVLTLVLYVYDDHFPELARIFNATYVPLKFLWLGAGMLGHSLGIWAAYYRSRRALLASIVFISLLWLIKATGLVTFIGDEGRELWISVIVGGCFVSLLISDLILLTLSFLYFRRLHTHAARSTHTMDYIRVRFC